VGMTTTIDHIPTAPIEAISTTTRSRTQAWRESGTKAWESGDLAGACTARNVLAGCLRVNPYCREMRHACAIDWQQVAFQERPFTCPRLRGGVAPTAGVRRISTNPVCG